KRSALPILTPLRRVFLRRCKYGGLALGKIRHLSLEHVHACTTAFLPFWTAPRVGRSQSISATVRTATATAMRRTSLYARTGRNRPGHRAERKALAAAKSSPR